MGPASLEFQDGAGIRDAGDVDELVLAEQAAWISAKKLSVHAVVASGVLQESRLASMVCYYYFHY